MKAQVDKLLVKVLTVIRYNEPQRRASQGIT